MFQPHNLPHGLAARLLRSCLLWISDLSHPGGFTTLRFLQGEMTREKFPMMKFVLNWSVSWSRCPWNMRRLQSSAAIIPLWNKITPEEIFPKQRGGEDKSEIREPLFNTWDFFLCPRAAPAHPGHFLSKNSQGVGSSCRVSLSSWLLGRESWHSRDVMC